jgi:5'-3' exoribonuclease 1
MTSTESPIIEYYPEEFGIDMNGKRSPWEAVVLLPFIDESRLVETESRYCKESMLTKDERARNSFGKVQCFIFNPVNIATYFSCNPEIGLLDIHNCQSSVSELDPDLSPGRCFMPEVIPGTISPYPGFPSLAILPITGVKMEAVKLNIFGSDSKYRSMILSIQSPEYPITDENAHLLQKLLGSIVYVDYPMSHEAKVVAISTQSFEYRVQMSDSSDIPGNTSILPIRIDYDGTASENWLKESSLDIEKYLKGRGTPGSGGLDIGKIHLRLRVLPLQGMRRDPVTGESRKVFGTNGECMCMCACVCV